MHRFKEHQGCLTQRGLESPHTQITNQRNTISSYIMYYPGLTNLSRVAKKHRPILHICSRSMKAIPDPPIVAFRWPKNETCSFKQKDYNTDNINGHHRHQNEEDREASLQRLSVRPLYGRPGSERN